MKRDNGKKQKSDARVSGEIAFYVLIALAAFVFVFIFLGAQMSLSSNFNYIAAKVCSKPFII